MEMNIKVKGLLISVVAGMSVFASQAWAEVASAPGVPGSVDDPVVTKSYVDEKVQQAMGGGGASRLVVEELQPGMTLYGFEGTEFIVRTGKVVSVAGVNGDGLTDLTGGADLKAGAPVQANHLLLIARSDSRGLRLSPDYYGKAFIMIRGKYQIQ